ncbi:discoidin domain-containing protein, partial [Nonomuraea sp. NPDC004297]
MHPRRSPALIVAALAALLLSCLVSAPAQAAACGTGNVALNRPATASSSENAGTSASAAVDGDAGTRWSSAFSDPQWLQVDLGSAQSICQVVLQWETAYATAFRLQVSDNASTWTDIHSTSTGTGGTQTLDVTGTGRYLRLYGTARATGWGYSLWELSVRTTTTTPPGGGDLGPNVHVFDPSMSSSSIQSTLNSVFSQMESNQFGTQRHALLFKPGSYNVNADIGFYTSIMGLGRNPDDVTINGQVKVDAGWFGGNATQNFWRSAENLSITPPGGTNQWAVSQAAPFRRMHVRGN